MFQLKEATLDDMDLYYEWANDPDVRSSSFNSLKIEYKEHCRWFQSAIKSIDCDMLILCKEEIPVAQIRVNKSNGVGMISFSVSKDHRRMGYSSLILKMLAERFFCSGQKIKLVGYVKYENIPSQKAFLAASFKQKDLGDRFVFERECL